MKKGKRFKDNNKRKNIILYLILIITIIILILNLQDKYAIKNDEKYNEILNDDSQVGNENVSESKTARMTKIEELQKENSDIVGWLEIENSNINYPVLQTSDNSFYMTHDYRKEYSRDGSLFLDKDYDWNLPSTNLLIYGHNNIGSSEMFVELLNYQDEEYYNTHKTIRLTTNKEDVEYEIIAVFKSRVYYKSEKNVFRYYYFINANNEEEFNEFVNNSKKASIYNIEATATYGDSLLTLSTCSYHTEDGRFAVVARKIN